VAILHDKKTSAATKSRPLSRRRQGFAAANGFRWLLMRALEQLITSGTFFDWVLIAIAVEALLLIIWSLSRGQQRQALRLLPNLLAGASLMLAVKLAIIDASWLLLAATLSLALVAHCVDLYGRLRLT